MEELARFPTTIWRSSMNQDEQMTILISVGGMIAAVACIIFALRDVL
jgi:hypothetical protein